MLVVVSSFMVDRCLDKTILGYRLLEAYVKLPSAKVVIDIVVVLSVAVAVAMTAVILARVMPGYMQHAVQEDAQVVAPAPDASRTEMGDQSTGSANENFEGDSTYSAEVPFTVIITDADIAAPDPLQASAPIILPIMWGAVAGTLIWRGKVRSQWHRQGYDYDMFRLVASMRGSATRVELLNAVVDVPKNKLQLAKELGVDWKTIDNHVEVLLKNGLVEERMAIGTSRYYGATRNANRVLSLLLSSDPSSSAGPDGSSGPGRPT
jgi:DNA-binding transcriptional ArsR family regulator